MRAAMRGAMLLALALAFYVGVTASRLGLRSDLGPGAGMFPFGLALLLAGLALLWLSLDLVAALRGHAGAPEWPEGPPPRGAAAVRLGGVLGALVVTACAMEHVGFPALALALAVALLLLLGERRPLVVGVVALLAGPGLFALFALGLGVGLPTGTLLSGGP